MAQYVPANWPVDKRNWPARLRVGKDCYGSVHCESVGNTFFLETGQPLMRNNRAGKGARMTLSAGK